MGKVLTILGSDFSKNGMLLLKAINLTYNTDSYQFVVNPTNTYWDGNTDKPVVTGGTAITPTISNLKSANVIGDDYIWLAFGSETYGNNLKTAEILDTEHVLSNMKCMFVMCQNLESVVLEGKPVNMQGVFHHCDKLTSIDMSNLDTSNTTIMYDLFRQCYALTEVDVSMFDTSKVTDMKNMFMKCTSLTSIDLSTFNTSKVTDMKSMFLDCTSLSSINLKGFNTSKVTSMETMFSGCQALKSIDISMFDTSKVTDMKNMFGNTNIETLDLTNFDMSKVTDVGTMFYKNSSLKTIKFGPKLSLAALTNTDSGTFSYAENISTIECKSQISTDDAITKVKALVSSTSNAYTSKSIDLICSDTTLHWDGTTWV